MQSFLSRRFLSNSLRLQSQTKTLRTPKSNGPSIFDQLSSNAKETAEVSHRSSKVSLTEAPHNVTPGFFSEYQQLAKRLESVSEQNSTDTKSKLSSPLQGSHLRLLSHHITTPEDTKLFSEAMDKFTEFKRIPTEDAPIYMDFLLKYNDYKSLLKYFCDRPRFGFMPTREQLRKTLNGLYEKDFKLGLIKADATDESKMAALDDLYKCFAVYLYSDVAPGQEEYSILVRAGLATGLEEGKRRSIVTAKEMKSLGLNVKEFENIL